MRAILIDANKDDLNNLERTLQSISAIQVMGKYSDPTKVDVHVFDEDINVVFLDIHFPTMNGFMFAKKIRRFYPEVEIVFITYDEQYAIDAFEIRALDYLIKPVREERVLQTINRLYKRYNKRIMLYRHY